VNYLVSAIVGLCAGIIGVDSLLGVGLFATYAVGSLAVVRLRIEVIDKRIR
jgi:hypothetical protein